MPERTVRKGAFLPRFLPLLALFFTLSIGAFGCTELAARQSVKEGNKLYGEGNYAKAIEKFQDAVAQSPDLEIAHHNLALAHLKVFQPGIETPENLDHARKAVEHIQVYLQAEPADQKIIELMIKTYVDAGDYDGAIAYWQAELEQSPGDPVALGELAKINERALRFEDALGWHQKRVDAAKTSDEKVNSLFAIANLQYRRLLKDQAIAGLERVTMADVGIAALQQALAVQPDNEQFFSILDVLYQQRALAHDVSWARAIEQTSALENRLKWRDIFQRKQQQEQSSDAASGSEPDESAPKGAGAKEG